LKQVFHCVFNFGSLLSALRDFSPALKPTHFLLSSFRTFSQAQSVFSWLITGATLAYGSKGQHPALEVEKRMTCTYQKRKKFPKASSNLAISSCSQSVV